MLFAGALALLFLNVVAERHDSDLMSFVTLPEVRALKWNVTHIDRERQAPGYWFVAPYGQINPEAPTQKYQQYQVGPYIYDNDGMLIWAGSPQFDNRNTFDFRPNIRSNGETFLSFIIAWDWHEGPDKGSGVILDNHYQVQKQVVPLDDVHDFNMHEFNLVDDGKAALSCVYRTARVNMADFGRPTEESWVMTGGFTETKVDTNEVLVQWNSLDHIALHESNLFHSWDAPAVEGSWDYVHANAVDKNEAGDYIISMRFTDTIYGVSGADGHVMWRLGGVDSDFDQDFNFSRQHDAKFVSSNGPIHVISFMNNAADERGNQEDVSSALIVQLDTTAMTARVVTRINRPDGGLTKLRGNVQTLPSGNIFVGWSEWGYHTEHAPNGDHLMSAWFPSERYSTYRSYKGEFVGRPTAPPDVAASVYGTSDIDITTIHVSWNGATDVAGWNFYAQAYDGGNPAFVGYADKTDFETMYIVDGYMDWITVEAVGRDGKPMSTSLVTRTQIPTSWHAAGFQGSENPTPDDPSLVAAPRKGSNGDSSVGHDSGMKDEYGSLAYADAKEVAKAVYKAYDIIRGVCAVLMLALVVCIVSGIVACVYRLLRRRKLRSYRNVPTEESESIHVEEIPLRSENPE